MTATVDMELERASRGASLVIWLVGAAVLAFLLWARFAWIDEIVRAEGEFVSASRPQIVQNLEGGILEELLVKEGDEVARGQVLARLRGTRFETSVEETRDQIAALEIRRLRLEAEMAGLFDFEVPPDLAARLPAIVASERALLNARQSDYVSRREGAERVRVETERELASMEDMYARGIVALFEVTEARKAHSDAENTLNEIVTSAELERAGAYSDTLKELATLRQTLRLAEDQLARTTIVAPMHGVVDRVAVTTIGGVVRPGEEIFQITPLGDDLLVEAKVAPRDVAGVREGQAATIKLSAYDYTVWGTLSGRVEFVSADSVKDERRPEAEAYYRVTVSVDLSALTDRQRDIALRPGMQAVVELHTGGKTVLQYLTKPLYRSREALREP